MVVQIRISYFAFASGHFPSGRVIFRSIKVYTHTHARTHKYHRHAERQSMHIVCVVAANGPTCVAIVVLDDFILLLKHD
jgi:hypothetical protein